MPASLPPFPDKFLFGVATSDHQCEAYLPEREDVWDVWERTQQRTLRGRASDFWNRFPEDIEHARKLGCKLFRFSIAWSRVEPEPGQYDDAAFDHYRAVVAAIRAAGMEPLVTLHHFTWPLHVQSRGGMTGPEFPEIFATYAAEVARRLGSAVTRWITFNEPTQLVYGFIKPWWEARYFLPPGLPEGASAVEQTDQVRALMRNLFVGHARARAEIKRLNASAHVGANPMLLGLPSWLQRFIDWNAVRVSSVERFIRQGRRFSSRKLVSWGRVDVVLANLTVTPDRSRKVAFSDTYYVAQQRLLATQKGGVARPEDLKGRTLAVVGGSTSEDDARLIFPNARLLVAVDQEEAISALDRGEAAAYLADDALLQGLLRKFPQRYALIGPTYSSEPYAAAVAKGNAGLLRKVNAAIRHFFHSGAMARSCERLGIPNQAPPPAEEVLAQMGTPSAPSSRNIPGPALRRIQRRGYLRVAVKDDVFGFAQRSIAGRGVQGIEIDLAKEMAQEIFGDPARVKFYRVKTRDRIPLVRSVLSFLEPLVKLYSTLSSMVSSNWWHLGMAGKLPEFLCPPECVGQQDFVGLDYYWGIAGIRLDRLSRLMDAIAGRFARAPVWPAVLHQMLRYHARLFPNVPLLIVENGSVDVADGVPRAEYLRRHVHEVQRAVHEGIPVEGYICWSITSNREWGLKFDQNSDFGLFHIALDSDSDLVRSATPAAEAYREMIARRSAE